MNEQNVVSMLLSDENISWFVPLVVTLPFSIVNAIIAWLNLRNAELQKEAQQVEIGIGLMQKRMNIYRLERSALEAIIEHGKPTHMMIAEMCNAELETQFLFGGEILEHFREVLKLSDEVMNYKKEPIPDEYGGYFDDYHDYEEEEFAQKAIELMGESIELYKIYIDFSAMGIAQKRR